MNHASNVSHAINLSPRTIPLTSLKERRPRSPSSSPEAQVGAGPVLRFTPTAWAKLLYFCHRGPTEIGGFGLTAAGDLLRVEDLLTVRQSVSAVTVAFEDAAVADLFEAQVAAGHPPRQFGRIWLHTHPGSSPIPSSVDEQTFARVFGACDWAVMFILARGGATYARLRFNVGPGGHVLIPVMVDYSMPFAAADPAAWEAEYQAHVYAEPADWRWLEGPAATVPDDLRADLTDMGPAERRMVLDELALEPDLWAEEAHAEAARLR
jgi:proteasome lid subunit RPN8/RPN11